MSRAQRRDGHDGQRRAALARAREDLVGAAQGRVELVGGREGRERQHRPVLAAVGLEREVRRERALARVRSRWTPSRRYITSSIASVASVVAWSTLRAGPPGIAQLGDRRVGLAPGRRRGVAGAQQRHLELLARGLPGREPLRARRRIAAPSAARPAKKSMPRARSPRRRRGRVLAALDDLRERRDRLGCAGAGGAWPSSSSDRGPVAVSAEARRGHARAARPRRRRRPGPALRGRHRAAGRPPPGRRPARCA